MKLRHEREEMMQDAAERRKALERRARINMAERRRANEAIRIAKSARELARSTRVRLIDGRALADWLEDLREQK